MLLGRGHPNIGNRLDRACGKAAGKVVQEGVKRLAPILALVVLLAAGCGGSRSSAPATAPTGTTTAKPPAPPTLSLRIYLLRDGKVAPVARTVDYTRAVATVAVHQLLAGPGRGEPLATAVPRETALRRLSIAHGVADAEFSQPLPPLAQAEVVYTLTQFPSVQSVSIDGSPPATRADFEDETPQILVESPLPGTAVTSPIRIRGTADTFEATFQADVVDPSGKKLGTTTVTATSGSGQRGTFDASIPVESQAPGAVVLRVYEVSAADGSHLHQVEIPLRLAKG